jgi:hypothetical protein
MLVGGTVSQCFEYKSWFGGHAYYHFYGSIRTSGSQAHSLWAEGYAEDSITLAGKGALRPRSLYRPVERIFRLYARSRRRSPGCSGYVFETESLTRGK